MIVCLLLVVVKGVVLCLNEFAHDAVMLWSS